MATPAALAAPVSITPTEAQQFTARVGLTFEAQSGVSPAPGRMDFYVARDQVVDGKHVLATPIDTFHAAPVGVLPAVYTAEPGSDANWPNKPGTYYWQAVYHNCLLADGNCYGPIRSLIVTPLPPPAQSAPANGATIPYGGHMTFTLQDQASYTHEGTHLIIEFSTSADLAPDGRFVDPLLVSVPRPGSAGVDQYEYDFGRPYTIDPGTYYWTVERFDCAAEPEPDCWVTNDEVRSFTVEPPVVGSRPNTRITRHPGHRTHRRKVTFRFSSSFPGASFECFYTGGWTPCQSPQKFRHLKPGRYRFKVRAVTNGKRDPTPAKFLFKVVRRHR